MSKIGGTMKRHAEAIIAALAVTLIGLFAVIAVMSVRDREVHWHPGDPEVWCTPQVPTPVTVGEGLVKGYMICLKGDQSQLFEVLMKAPAPTTTVLPGDMSLP